MPHQIRTTVREKLKGWAKDNERRTGIPDYSYRLKLRPKRQYFNNFELENAFAYRETNPELARELLEDYMAKYPFDATAYLYYASVLISLQQYDTAEKVLDTADLLMLKGRVFRYCENKREYIKKSLARTRVKLLGMTHRYEELLQLYEECPEYLGDLSEDILFYYRTVLDPSSNRFRDGSYLIRQIIEWREDDFLDHVLKHTADVNQNDKNISPSFFVPDFPLERVYQEVRKHIPCSTRYSLGYFEDIYIFKYDECGRDNDRLVDYFKVVTFHDTDKIITMCPSLGCENLPSIDINSIRPKKPYEAPRVYQISQIDKFNHRYFK